MEVLQKKLIPIPKIGECYRHYKDNNKQYRILGIALDVDDNKERVIYQNTTNLKTYSREITDFRSHILIENRFTPRFSKVN